MTQEYVITGVQFGVWGPEDIERQATIDLTEFGTKGNLNSFTDGRFGANGAQSMCFDCRGSHKTCTGHWGIIRLGCILPNPFFIKEIKNLLQCFCLKCSALLYTKDRIELDNIHLLSGEARIKHISTILEKSNGTFFCPNPNCETPVNQVVNQDDKFLIKYCNDSSKKKNKTLPLEYEEIYGMFKNISNEDLETVGFNSHLIQSPEYLDPSTFTNSVMTHRHQNRPENFFVTILPVLPLCIRPCTSQGNEMRHDPATILYQLILKSVKALKEAKNEKEISTAKETIQKHIFALFKQKGDDNGTQKTYNSMNNRLSGKDGDIRGAVESKRADYGGRLVVGNAPYLGCGWVELPQEMAKISQMEYACNVNLAYWNKVLIKDKQQLMIVGENYKNYKKRREIVKKGVSKTVTVIHGVIRKQQIFYDPTIQYVTKKGTGTKTSVKFINKIENGDIIHRLLRKDDMCIINRQPTIRKESYNGHRILICPNPNKRTSGIPLSDMPAYNMD